MAEEMTQAHWYVVHTYAGYENKVKTNLEKTVKNRGMQDVIMEVRVPMEEVEEIRNERRQLKQQKVFPGYVLVRMIRTNEAWYVVRNTRGVTGFVGPGGEPIPLTDEEVASIGQYQKAARHELAVGDRVRILGGALKDMEGVIEEIAADQSKVRVIVSMFGRDTPVNVAVDEITQLNV